jgi:hypothetical protein
MGEYIIIILGFFTTEISCIFNSRPWRTAASVLIIFYLRRLALSQRNSTYEAPAAMKLCRKVAACEAVMSVCDSFSLHVYCLKMKLGPPRVLLALGKLSPKF